MGRAAALLLAALVASPSIATAQTTTCGEEWGKWVCRTEADRSSNTVRDFQFDDPSERSDRAYERTVRLRQDREMLEAAAQAAPPTVAAPPRQGVLLGLMAEGNTAVRRAKVAEALRDGRCEDAKMIALAEDDLDLADQAVRICTPKNP